MAAKLKVTINNKEYSANPGQTILELVRERQIDDIPTLCHDPKLPPYGSCYLCVVEIQGLEKLVPSCASPLADGMVIHTDNTRIRESRKTALELLLSNHYADCLGPCTRTCPAGVDVQGYIALISAGRYREAVKLIKEKNPLPLVCGRVCVRECESACRRNLVDDPVGIDYLKRFAADIDIENPWMPAAEASTGKKVAIIGGGPAGLTCAYFLALKGHAATIFEQSPALGGMLRYGIPEYRLPKQMLDREIKWITDLCADVKTNVNLGKDITIDSLKKNGFDAIFMAIGAQKAKGMGLDGETEVPGVIGGADFLRKMQAPTDEGKPKVFGRVVVVGGGNTAIDAARTSLRLGAAKVTILYRRTRKEMPANEMEVEAAIEEGIEMIFLSAPTAIVTRDGRLRGLQCIRMELGEPDTSGRRSPVPVQGSEYLLECDFVISAIGQDIDLGTIIADGRLKVTRSKAIQTNKATFETSIPGVFAGGDATTGPAVAIDAIAHGRLAAEAIDGYMREGKAKSESAGFVSRKESFGNLVESDFAQYPKIPREKMPELPVAERIKNLAEVEVGFTGAQASNEASRCLECGCSAYFDCALRKYATDFGVDLTRFVGDVRKYKIDRDHPFIALDPNKCISCGRCVRTCSEILKISALGFVYRGFKSVVKPSMEKKLLQTNCISCGNCISACPTGAITEKVPFAKPGPWAAAELASICSFCSLGCNLKYKVFHNHLFSVASTNGASHNKGYLCPKGRFGYRYMLDEARLLAPMIRKSMRQRGEYKEATWDEAIEYAARRVRDIIETHGPRSVAVLGSPRMTNEELYLLQKLARVGLKTNNIGSFTNLLGGIEQDALDDMFGITTSTATTDDLATADLILVVNPDVSEESLIAELKIKAAQKNGARLVTISSSEIELNKSADLWVDPKRGTVTALIQGMSNEVIRKGLADTAYIRQRTEGYETFKESVAEMDAGGISEITGVSKEKIAKFYDVATRSDQKIVVVYNLDAVWEKSRNDLKAIGNFLMLTGRAGNPGNGIILLRDYVNAQGLLDMGMDARYLTGHVRAGDSKGLKKLSSLWGTDLSDLFTPVNLKEQLEEDKIKALLIFGEDPLAEPNNIKLTGGVEFLLVLDHFMTTTAMEADVVLPASLPVETEGTVTACDRRVQEMDKIFDSRTGMANWQVIARLAAALGIPFNYGSVKDITAEINAAIPAYGDMNGKPFWGGTLFEKKFMTANGKGKFSVLQIDITPYSVDKKHLISSENYFRTKVKNRLVARV